MEAVDITLFHRADWIMSVIVVMRKRVRLVVVSYVLLFLLGGEERKRAAHVHGPL